MVDNRNRAAADVRHAFTHHGGSIGTPGCVAWMFKKKGIIVVSKEAADEDTLMMIALDAGAEDVSTDGDGFEITTAPEDFLTVSEALEKEGIAVEASEVTMVPDNTVSLEGDAADVMNKLTGELEELDDVLQRALEISSMGIRVDKAAMLKQLELAGKEERTKLYFHQRLLNDTLPLTIGGGIGQSRLCMLYLKKAHIGEIQASIWPEDMREECAQLGMQLI